MASTYVQFPVRTWQLAWYSLIAIVGSVGNALVLYLAFSNKRKRIRIDHRAPFNVYLITLAIVDLMISLSCVPVYLLSTSLFKHPGGASGEWMCKIVTGYFVPFWLLDISAFILVAIALERHRAVTQPFSNMLETRLSKTLFSIGIIILLSIVTQTPTIYGSHYVSENGTIGSSCIYGTRSTALEIMHWNSFLLGCIIPFMVFVVCFYQIYRQLSKTSTMLHSTLEAYANSDTYKHKVKLSMNRTRETANTMLIVTGAFIVCVIINEVFFNVLKPILNATDVQWNQPIYQFTVMLRFTNSAINPILYSFKSQVFRKRLKETFCKNSGHEKAKRNRRLRVQHQFRNSINKHVIQYGVMPRTPSNIV